MPEAPAPVLGGVRTHIRGSQYGVRGLDEAGDDMEMRLQGPFITVTQVVHTEQVRRIPFPSKEVKNQS